MLRGAPEGWRRLRWDQQCVGNEELILTGQHKTLPAAMIKVLLDGILNDLVRASVFFLGCVLNFCHERRWHYNRGDVLAGFHPSKVEVGAARVKISGGEATEAVFARQR